MTAKQHAHVQVKICGLTEPAQATACVAAGADAIGLVFYPPSPRNVSIGQAAAIVAALPAAVPVVGVFVDMPVDDICEVAVRAGLETVQLHGSEAPDTVERLHAAKIRVIRVLKRSGDALLEDAAQFRGVDAFLIECGKGALPGGNAAAWDWGGARPLSGKHPMALAGGLSGTTVAGAIDAAQPDAVDVSSAVEAAPGRKDLKKVAEFIEQAKGVRMSRHTYRVF